MPRRCRRGERVTPRPKRMLERMEEVHQRLDLKGSRNGKLAKLRPCGNQCRQGPHPAVRMIGRTLTMRFPWDRAVPRKFISAAALPPLLPQISQIVARIRFRALVQTGLQKSGHTKQHRFHGIRLGTHRIERRTLRKKSHRQGIAAVTKRLGAGKKQGRVPAMRLGDFQPSRCLHLSPMHRRLTQQALNTGACNVLERIHTTPRMRDRDLTHRTIQGIRQLRFADHNLHNLAVLTGPREKLPRARLENHMQDHILECRIHRMTMRLPCLGRGIKLERTTARFTIDLDRRMDEVRTLATIPFAKLHKLHPLATDCAKLPPKSTGKPQGLQLKLRRQGTHTRLGKCQGRMPHRF